MSFIVCPASGESEDIVNLISITPAKSVCSVLLNYIDNFNLLVTVP